jgi:hypothetical protein
MTQGEVSACRSARTRKELRRDNNNENRTGIIVSAGYTAGPVNSMESRRTEFLLGTAQTLRVNRSGAFYSTLCSVTGRASDGYERYLLQIGVVVFSILFALAGCNLLNGDSCRQQGAKILGVHLVKRLHVRQVV